jgi:hypothetical protein
MPTRSGPVWRTLPQFQRRRELAAHRHPAEFTGVLRRQPRPAAVDRHRPAESGHAVCVQQRQRLSQHRWRTIVATALDSFIDGPNGFSTPCPPSPWRLRSRTSYMRLQPRCAAAPLYTSTDGGSTWTAGANVNAPGYPAALAVDPTNPSTVWVAATDGTSRRARTAATHFKPSRPLAATLPPLPSPSIPQTPAGLCSYLHQRLRDVDGGTTWSPVLSGFAYTVYAAPSRAFAFSSTLPTTVFLTKLDPALSQVIYSTYLWTGSVGHRRR